MYELLNKYELPKRKAQKRPGNPDYGTENDPPFKEGDWGPEQQEAFVKLKHLLTTAPILVPPDFSKEFILEADASNRGLGAVLLQPYDDGTERIITYLSRRMTDAELKYDTGTSQKEGLAVVWACRELRYYLLGRRFLIRSDHEPLKWALNLESPSMSRDKRQLTRLMHWAIALEEYDYVIVHKPGKSQIFADPLSRDFPDKPAQGESKDYTETTQMVTVNKVVACLVSVANNRHHQQILHRVACDTTMCSEALDGVQPRKTAVAVKAVGVEQGVGAANPAPPAEKPQEGVAEQEAKAAPAGQPDKPKEALPTPEEVKIAQQDDDLLGPIYDYLEFEVLPTQWEDWKSSRQREWRKETLNYYINPTNGLLYRNVGWDTQRKEDQEAGINTPPAMLLAIPVSKGSRKHKIAERILAIMHDDPFAAHFGFAKTLAKLQTRFWWENMSADVRRYCRTCERCQMVKGRFPKIGNRLNTISVEEPFEIIHLDLIENLAKTKDGFQHILVIIDKFSKWPELIPMKTKDAQEMCAALMRYWVTHYGVPRSIIADGGKQFQSNMASILYAHLGIQGRTISPHHPQTNSQVERMNRVIKEALRNMVAENQKDWPDYLDSIAFAYRSAVNESTGFSPYQLLYGRQPVLPVDILYGEPSKVEAMERDEGKYHLRLTTNLREAWKLAFSKNEEARKRQKEYYDKEAKDRAFEPGDWVLARARPHTKKEIKKALMLPLTGPFVVVRKTSESSYELKDARDKSEQPVLKRVNVIDIIPFHRRTLARVEEEKDIPVMVLEQMDLEELQPMPAPLDDEKAPVDAVPAVALGQPQMVRQQEEPEDQLIAQAAQDELIEQEAAQDARPEESLPEQEEKAPVEQIEVRPKKRGRKRVMSGPQHNPTCWSRIINYKYQHMDDSHKYLVEWVRPQEPGQAAPGTRLNLRNCVQTWVDLSECEHKEQIDFIRAFNMEKGLNVPLPVVANVGVVLSGGGVSSDRACLGARVRYSTYRLQPVYLLQEKDSFGGT